MKLNDFKGRPTTLIGLHGSQANIATFDRQKWVNIVRSLHPGCFKIVDDSNAGQKTWARMLRQAGITPIIRPFLPTCTPTPNAIRAYIDEGITKWIEPWNEPNIDQAWSGYMNFVGVVELAEGWLTEAEKIISWGGYPAFPSMAECGLHPVHSSIEWYKRLFKYLGQHHRDRARRIFQNGAWLAVHDATLNRFWKDEQGEYHFEHPYSKLVYDHLGWKPTLWDDDCSLIGHQVPVYLMRKHLGDDIEVPVISTEGGIFAGLVGKIPDDAYPAFDGWEHARATVAMFRWLHRYALTYPWYFGMCPWKFAPFGYYPDAWPNDNWIKKGGKKLAVVRAVMNMGAFDPNAQPLGPIGLFKEGPSPGGLWDNVPEEIARWRKLVEKVTSSYHVPIPPVNGVHVSPGKTVPCIIMKESSGNPNAVNVQTGATGLMQIMPFHFEEGQDPFDPEWNIRKGLAILKQKVDITGDLQMALFYYSGRKNRPWEPFIRDYWQSFIRFYKDFWGIDLETKPEPAPEPEPDPEPEPEPTDKWPRPPNDNGIGIHFGDCLPKRVKKFLPLLKELHVKWVVLADESPDLIGKCVPMFLKEGIMPVVRPQTPIDAHPRFSNKARWCKSPYVQIYNEPGDSREWDYGKPEDWWEIFMDKWIKQAHGVRSVGCYPGLQVIDAGELQKMLLYMVEQNETDLWPDMWLSVHSYPFLGCPPVCTKHEDDVLGFLKFVKVCKEIMGFVPPIIVTETAWTSSQASPETRAKWMVEVFEWFKNGQLSNGEQLPDYLFAFCPWILFGKFWFGFSWVDNIEHQPMVEAVKKMENFIRK